MVSRISVPYLISIHAPRAGCDLRHVLPSSCRQNFNPRTPCGVRLERNGMCWDSAQFQSTHPVRGATVRQTQSDKYINISIHAPRAGCDLPILYGLTAVYDFNPRTPCGVRPTCLSSTPTARLFQSTHPVRGATKEFAGNDFLRKFQSTHPVRGATRKTFNSTIGAIISIHAPRAGCDLCRAPPDPAGMYFNPRTPCGVRPRQQAICAEAANFNPRTPCGVRQQN